MPTTRSHVSIDSVQRQAPRLEEAANAQSIAASGRQASVQDQLVWIQNQMLLQQQQQTQQQEQMKLLIE